MGGTETLFSIVRLLIPGVIAVLGFTIATQLLTGQISTRHLLYGRRSDGSLYFSAERVQLLVLTLGVAFHYLLTVKENPGTLPDVSNGTLLLLGGSHAIYLGGKAYQALSSTRHPNQANSQTEEDSQ